MDRDIVQSTVRHYIYVLLVAGLVTVRRNAQVSGSHSSGAAAVRHVDVDAATKEAKAVGAAGGELSSHPN